MDHKKLARLIRAHLELAELARDVAERGEHEVRMGYRSSENGDKRTKLFRMADDILSHPPVIEVDPRSAKR